MGVVLSMSGPNGARADTQSAERVAKAQVCSAILVNSVDREIQLLYGARTVQDYGEWAVRIGDRMGVILAWQSSVLDALVRHPDGNMVDAVLEQCLKHPRLR